MCVCVCVRGQSCPTLCNPMNYSLPGSSVRGIFQARTLEWVPFPPPYKKSMLHSIQDLTSWTRNQTCAVCTGSVASYPLDHQGSPSLLLIISFWPLPSTGKFLQNTGPRCLGPNTAAQGQPHPPLGKEDPDPWPRCLSFALQGCQGSS